MGEGGIEKSSLKWCLGEICENLMLMEQILVCTIHKVIFTVASLYQINIGNRVLTETYFRFSMLCI